MERDFGNREKIFFLSQVNISDKDILEIGCGSGYFSKILASQAKNLTIIDPVRRNLQNTKRSLINLLFKINSYCLSGSNLYKLKDNSFDLVVFPYSLHHHKDPGQALIEAFRVLKTGGEIVIIELLHRGEYCQFLAPVHNEEKELLAAQKAIINSPFINKSNQDYLVDWFFSNRQDLQRMIIDNFNLPIQRIAKILDPLPMKGQIRLKDSVTFWLLKK